MKKYTKQDIIQLVKENDVQFIRLQFTDVFGALKNIAVSVSQLERALDNKCRFDGSAMEGFIRNEESDMYLYPDLNTFTILPWQPQNGKVARFMCDVYRPEGIPFEGDSRYILKKVLRKAAAMDYTFNVAPECEFFLFHRDENGRPLAAAYEKAGYFDMVPLDQGETIRRDIILNLEQMGLEIQASHHEAAPSQHEIDLKYNNALAAADNIMTLRMAVKAVAKRHGFHATFMPKPIQEVDGSGMHIDMSLFKEGKNSFYDKNDPKKLSADCYHFVAGLMRHVRGMTCVCNPLVNSYKRLVPGYEAPVDIAWSSVHRSPLIRIPTARGAATRVEFRSPDGASNPYLAMALCLAAGLDGIEHKMEPPKQMGRNVYLMTEEQLRSMKIGELPRTLGEACRALEEDLFLQKILGPHIAGKFLKAKKKEWDHYCEYVSQWEIDHYLYKI